MGVVGVVGAVQFASLALAPIVRGQHLAGFPVEPVGYIEAGVQEGGFEGYVVYVHLTVSVEMQLLWSAKVPRSARWDVAEGEFVLAELTRPFNCSDVSYFFLLMPLMPLMPLMANVERRLGFRLRFGAFDAAFDAFYVYEHFRKGQTDPDFAFAAVPFSQRGGHRLSFDPNGLPSCKAGLPIPLESTFWSKRTLVPHECGRYVCPLRFPAPTGQPCSSDYEQWPKGGCITRSLPASARASATNLS